MGTWNRAARRKRRVLCPKVKHPSPGAGAGARIQPLLVPGWDVDAGQVRLSPQSTRINNTRAH